MIAAPTEVPGLNDSLAGGLEPPPGPPRWHLRVNGLESGPVTWEVLRRLAGSGELKPTDAVRRTDEVRWVPASEARCPEVAARTVVVRQRVVPTVVRPTTGIDESRTDEPEASATDALQPHKSVAAASGSPACVRPDGVRGQTPPSSGPNAGAALLALGLSLAGLLAFALPLGMLAVYLGGTSAAGLTQARGGRLRLAVPLLAVAVGLADVGVSLRVLGGRLCDLGGQVVTAAR